MKRLLEFMNRVSLIGFALIIVGVIFGVVGGILISTLNGPLYATIILVCVTAGLVITGIVFVLKGLLKVIDEMASAVSRISNQLERFSKREIAIENVKYNLPQLTTLQNKLNLTIRTFSRYEFTLKPDFVTEYQVAAKEHTLIPIDQFKEAMMEQIESVKNYRGACILFKAVGDRVDDKTMALLYKAICQETPKHDFLISRYDETTYAVFSYMVTNRIIIESWADEFVKGFNEANMGFADDKAIINHCRIGVSLYPQSPSNHLLEDATIALASDDEVSIYMPKQQFYIAHTIKTEEEKKRQLVAGIASFSVSYSQLKTPVERKEALDGMLRFVSKVAGFDNAGILVYQEENDAYELKTDIQNVDGIKSFAKFGTLIPRELISILVDSKHGEDALSGYNSRFLPSVYRNLMTNIGVGSFYLSPITRAGKSIGLVYFTSEKPRDEFSLLDIEMLFIYSSYIKDAVFLSTYHAIDVKETRMFENFLAQGGKSVYSVNPKTHRLISLSEGLREAFPNAKIGDVCYQALSQSVNEPCKRCPLAIGATTKFIKELGSDEKRLTVLSYGDTSREESTILIENAAQDSASSIDSKLVDPVMLIKNAVVLENDFMRAVKMGTSGYVLLVRLDNPKDIMNKFGQDAVNSVMVSLVKRFVSIGHRSIIYAYDSTTLAFLNKSATRISILDFVEEISLNARNELSFIAEGEAAKLSFAALNFPNDISTEHQLNSVGAKTLEEAAKAGTDMLAFPGEKGTRSAIRSRYILGYVKKAIAEDQITINLQPIYNIEYDRKILGAEALSRLYDPTRGYIPAQEFVEEAVKANLMHQLDILVIKQVIRLYEANAYDIFKAANLKFLSINISDTSIKDPEFASNVKKAIGKVHFPKGFLRFEIGERDIKQSRDYIDKIQRELADYNIEWVVDRFSLDTISTDPIKDLMFTRIKMSRSVLVDATTNQNDLNLIARFSGVAANGGYKLSIEGIETQEQYDTVRNFGIYESQGYFMSRPLAVDEFIKLLNYSKTA